MRRATQIIIALVVALWVVLTIQVSMSDAHGYKITLCHATGSETNPYVKITISHHARDTAHIDRTTGRYHGQNNGTFDYEIAEDDTCATPASPSTEPTPSPSPTATETPAPTSTPMTSTAPSASPMLPNTATETAHNPFTTALINLGIGMLIGTIVILIWVAYLVTHGKSLR